MKYDNLTPISMINLVGTHDSASAYTRLVKAARCQYFSIEQQLNMGIRFLDIRLMLDKKGFRLIHALSDCFVDENKTQLLYFDKVLSWCEDFLKANPDEFIVMSVKRDRGSGRKSSLEFFERFFNDYVKGNSIWFNENRIPTYGECKGKIVLMRRCICTDAIAPFSGLDFSHWPDHGKPYQDDVFPIYLNHDTLAFVQDSYGLKPIKKYLTAKGCMDNFSPSEKIILVNFFSTASIKPIEISASEINNNLCEANIPQTFGWVFLDFADKKTCDRLLRGDRI